VSAIIAAYLPAAILWIGALYKLPSFYREPRNPGRRNLWLTFFFIATSVTVLLPPVYVGIDRLTGIANVSRLLSNSVTLLACWALQAFLSYVSRADQRTGAEVRRNGWLLVVCVVAMTGLFLTAPVPREALNFVQRYGDAPHILEYRLVYLIYLGLSQVTLIRLAWHYAQVADHPSLRLGMRIWAVSGPIALAYVANDGVYLIFRRLGLTYPIANPAALDQVLVALALGVGAVGTTMPSWGPHVGIPRLHRWVQDYRSVRRLYSLWADLCRSNPEIALVPPPRPLIDRLTFGDVEFRLHRRVVEIRDGMLALRPYADPKVQELAHRLSCDQGLDDQQTAAVVDAATLAAAQWSKAKGQAGREKALPSTSGGQNLEEEVRVLERMADCYTHSPIVRQIRAAVVGKPAEPGASVMQPMSKQS